jgi:pseudouridine-5'-phosphate glycosidase
MINISLNRFIKSQQIYSFSKRNISNINSLKPFIEISNEVQNALKLGLPIVALESTIISHGMPYPRNIKVAYEVEDKIREHGAIPATIAIINGIPKIGLNEHDMNILSNQNNDVVKASRRDMAYVCSNKLSAGTTVASTMILSHLAGIKVFATGGIGGVHRGGEVSMDVSADLLELSHTPVTVVCAGVKSILDIPRTLEVLETHGVPVIGYGTDIFPAFFTNDSGVKSPISINNVNEIAKLMSVSESLSLISGMIVAVPNPSPGESVQIQAAIDSSLASAAELGIYGSKVTPYILAEVERITKGKSLDSNISLVMNNARVAAEIACSYNNMNNINKFSKSQLVSNNNNNNIADIISFGGAVIDLIAKAQPKALIKGSSNPGSLRSSYGGVVRNITEALARRGCKKYYIYCCVPIYL